MNAPILSKILSATHFFQLNSQIKNYLKVWNQGENDIIKNFYVKIDSIIFENDLQ